MLRLSSLALIVSAALLTGCGEDKPKSMPDSKVIKEKDKAGMAKYEAEMKKGDGKKEDVKKDEGKKDEGKKEEEKKEGTK